MKNSSAFFKNTECEFFPCHSGIDEEKFNCLFCYCPLYAMQNCSGEFIYLDDGVKDCSACKFPHVAENYLKIIERLKK